MKNAFKNLTETQRMIARYAIISCSILFFSLVVPFAITSYQFVYYTYFDQTKYVTLTEPFSTEKILYSPGETVKISFSRQAIQTIPATATLDLVLLTNKGDEEVYSFNYPQFSFQQGFLMKTIQFKLPENLNNGSYYIIQTSSYKINGVEKKLVWKTNNFTVGTVQ